MGTDEKRETNVLSDEEKAAVSRTISGVLNLSGERVGEASSLIPSLVLDMLRGAEKALEGSGSEVHINSVELPDPDDPDGGIFSSVELTSHGCSLYLDFLHFAEGVQGDPSATIELHKGQEGTPDYVELTLRLGHNT